MKKIAIVLMFVNCSFTIIYGQKNLITDSTMILGLTTKDCAIGKSFDDRYCIKYNDKNLPKGTSVVVCGIKECEGMQLIGLESTRFYEVFYRKKAYFIDSRDLKISDDYQFEDIRAYFSEIDTIPPKGYKAYWFKFNAERTAQVAYDIQLHNIMKFLYDCKPVGLAILQWSFFKESEYTEGMSAKVEVFNPTSKTIKYLWFTFIGYNPVGDPVVDLKKGTSSITVKAVGPIDPDKNGSYEFKYVWFTDLTETAKISSIKVQYMDGSFKTLFKPKSVMLDDKSYEWLTESD